MNFKTTNKFTSIKQNNWFYLSWTPPGSAAANINGNTLHSLFGFKFGATFRSMSDKQRAQKRCQLRNLKCIIIDEMSLVSADLFYNLDLKLREITMVERPMGGVSVFMFGDLFQIRPVKAKYVFEEPTSMEHAVSQKLRNLWNMFTVVNLEENHRQGEDRSYAELLNRVRTGEWTDKDIKMLETRVRDEDGVKPASEEEQSIFKTQKTKTKEAEAVKPVPAASRVMKEMPKKVVLKIEEKLGERLFIGTTETESYLVKESGQKKMVQGGTYTLLGPTVVDEDVLETNEKIPVMKSKAKIERTTLPENKERLIKKIEKMKAQTEEEEDKREQIQEVEGEKLVPTGEEEQTLFKAQQSKTQEAEAVKLVPADKEGGEEEKKKISGALHIYGTNKKVNARNETKLNEIHGELYSIKAANNARMIKNFKPKVDNSGCVKGTPFQAVLKVKKGAEVVCVHNICTVDGLTNGARGVLLGVEKKENKVKRLIVRFHNKNHGREAREKTPCYKHPEGTYIEPVTWQYFLGSSTATVQQFPIKMCAAITAHKIQGQTVTKPNSLVVDINDTGSGAGMVYVMLSRVCSSKQLIILNSIKTEKITVSPLVQVENRRMNLVSVNMNLTPWNNRGLTAVGVPVSRVSSLNVRSLRMHMEDVRSDHVLLMSDVMCLQETWLEEGEEEQEKYRLAGYESYFNSRGKGKGIVSYLKTSSFQHNSKINEPHLQISKLSASDMDVINIYRSQEAKFSDVANHLRNLVDTEKTTVVLGDLNYCSMDTKNDLSDYLAKEGFQQLVTGATHVEGNLLDHIHYLRPGHGAAPVVETFARYYSDHDLVTVLLS